MPNAPSQPISEMIYALKQGGVAIVPTETVYGLAARADTAASVERIYTLKGRGFDKPLALCVDSLEMAETYGHMSGLARDLAQAFWPGPLSLIVKAKTPKNGKTLDARLYGRDKNGRKTISLRCPQAKWLSAVKSLPLALTSANPSGQAAPLNAEDAATIMGEGVDTILAGPPCSVGLSSTIMAINGREATVLRRGSLTPEDFTAFNIQGQDW